MTEEAAAVAAPVKHARATVMQPAAQHSSWTVVFEHSTGLLMHKYVHHKCCWRCTHTLLLPAHLTLAVAVPCWSALFSRWQPGRGHAVGSGGYADIYRVTDIASGATYALKHLRLNGDPQLIVEVQREAKTQVRSSSSSSSSRLVWLRTTVYSGLLQRLSVS
jgi:hypothetical protein